MKKEITLGSLLGILVPIFVALLGWCLSLSSRVENNDMGVKTNKESINKFEESFRRIGDKFEKSDDKMDQNFKIIIDKLDKKQEK